MRIAIIGRSEILLRTAASLMSDGHEIALVVSSKGVQEYQAQIEDFQRFANEIGASFLRQARITGDEAELRATGIDIGVSYNHPTIIGPKVSSRFPLGILNAHGGDLPRYRGNACQAWAMLNGEARIGLCVHKMNSGLDAGDIVARDYYPVDISTKITQVHEWMTERVPDLFVEALRKLKDDPTYVLERQSDDPADALRCYPRRPEDARIDWTRSAEDILRLVKVSCRPYSGAFFFSEEKLLRCWDAELVQDEERFLAIPGQITRIANDSIEVATGHGKIRLLEIRNDDGTTVNESQFRSLRQRLA